jgi:hypothetical protein
VAARQSEAVRHPSPEKIRDDDASCVLTCTCPAQSPGSGTLLEGRAQRTTPILHDHQVGEGEEENQGKRRRQNELDRADAALV